MQPEFHSGAVTRPLSAILQLAMMGCPALRARGELAAGACAPVLGWDRGGSSSAGARAWWGACGTGARGPLTGVFGRLPLAWLRESAFWGACTKYFRELTVECSLWVRQSLSQRISHPLSEFGDILPCRFGVTGLRRRAFSLHNLIQGRVRG